MHGKRQPFRRLALTLGQIDSEQDVLECLGHESP